MSVVVSALEMDSGGADNMEPSELEIDGLSRDQVMSLAKLAHEIGLSKEATTYAKSAIRIGFENSPDAQLGTEDLKLLSDLLNKKVAPLRRAIAKVDSIRPADLARISTSAEPTRSEELQFQYRKTLVKDLVEICSQVIELIRDILLPTAKGSESKVFFSKMAGDFNRYVAQNPMCAECDIHDKDAAADKLVVSQAIRETEHFYNSAYKLAQTSLAPTHPVRLALELNMAVFYYEVKDEKERAVQFAKEALDDAVAELDVDEQLLEEDTNSERNGISTTTNTLKMLRENLELWERS